MVINNWEEIIKGLIMFILCIYLMFTLASFGILHLVMMNHLFLGKRHPQLLVVRCLGVLPHTLSPLKTAKFMALEMIAKAIHYIAAEIQIGIGINTGYMSVGNIGSDRRTDFTAVGDAVNVAHRLEKLARPGEILVSEAVQRRVRGAVQMRFEGERQLSGREEPVHVYSVELPAHGTPAPIRDPLVAL